MKTHPNIIGMVGIFNKIKSGISALATKAKKNLIPVLGSIGDVVASDKFQKIMGYVTPAITMINPALGTGLRVAVKGLSIAGKMASQAREVLKENPNASAMDLIKGSLIKKPTEKIEPNQTSEPLAKPMIKPIMGLKPILKPIMGLKPIIRPLFRPMIKPLMVPYIPTKKN
ncbi:hypothetical protein FACS189472_18480 [Alphaproteobacteria bacterium]|nr:hypothetical protein FACS189472_18480 [Alphaproteobacteria bacterium]